MASAPTYKKGQMVWVLAACPGGLAPCLTRVRGTSRRGELAHVRLPRFAKKRQETYGTGRKWPAYLIFRTMVEAQLWSTEWAQLLYAAVRQMRATSEE